MCMMNTIIKTFDENDISIHKNGIRMNNIFFNKKEIADVFNELILLRSFIKKQSEKRQIL